MDLQEIKISIPGLRISRDSRPKIYSLYNIADCMFYTNVQNVLTKQDLVEVARRLQANESKIENREFSYNCIEIGFECSVDSLCDWLISEAERR